MTSQKTQLTKILNQQTKNNRLYSDLRVALITAMYMSLLDGGNLNKRIKRIIDDNNEAAVVAIVAMVLLLYKRLKKVDGSNAIAEKIEHSHILEESHSEAYKIQRKEIGEQKEAYIMSDIQYNGMHNRWFYLCSHHEDSAKDHAPYQGKIYIDDNCNDEKCLALARKYHMQSYQWVIGKPVWMVTRPNCRHYFKALSYEDIVGKSYQQLIDEHKMTRKIGNRPIMQTLKGGNNVEIVIKSYEERLKLHISMYRVRPNQFLQSAIEKDKLLLKKWKNKL